MNSILFEACKDFYTDLVSSGILSVSENKIASIADRANETSCQLSLGLVKRLSNKYQLDFTAHEKSKGQTAGNSFEICVSRFLKQTFLKLDNLRPGNWTIEKITGRGLIVAQYEQYAHLKYVSEIASKDIQLSSSLGTGYSILPDVVIARTPESDTVINQAGKFVDDELALHSALRSRNNGLPILHASISCKFTLRSDRAQNARSEALSFIRNRKGRVPHIILVTAEPLPSRLASIALGTGDIDCVYHFALQELLESIRDMESNGYKGIQDSRELLEGMVLGKRLKDISDLPLDLAI